jgi:hypothetical protein
MRNQSTATDRRKFVVNGGFLTSSFDCGHSAYGPELTIEVAPNFGLTGKVRRCPEADTIKLRGSGCDSPDQGNIPVYPSPWKARDSTRSGNGSAHTKTQEFRLPFWD